MSDITLIDDSEQSSLVTNGLAKNGELYLKKAGSTDAGSIVAYDSGSWRTFANEYAPSFTNAYSVDFDGSNDYVDITGARGVFDSATTFSISLWYYADNYAGAVFGSSFTATDGVWLLPYSSSTFFFSVRNGGGTSISTTPPALNQWVHLVATYNAGNGALYLTPAGGSTSITTSTSLPTSLSSNAGINLSIGRLALAPGYYFNGKVDEVAIWDSELSSSDVTAIYNSGTPDDLTSYSPVGWWRMGDNDGGTGTTITDQGSGSNDGALANSPTFSTTVPS